MHNTDENQVAENTTADTQAATADTANAVDTGDKTETGGTATE
jgi:hypothetical protein